MQTADAMQRRYSLGEFTLDLNRGALLKDELEIRLRPKSFQMLCYLAERNGQLVSKQELLDSVWKGIVVTDDAVTQCLVEIRRAIDDGEHEKIRTVPRRGYILDMPKNAGKDRTASTPTGDPYRRRWSLAALLAILFGVAVIWWASGKLGDDQTRDLLTESAIAPTPSIAVLPFVDMSPEQDQEYFGDGIAEELLNVLTRVPGLRVIARTSSFSFKDQPADITEIASRLSVSHILEGSVRKSGEQFRITVQLVDGKTSEHIWSETYDHSFGEVFEIQDEISAEVLKRLHVTLLSSEQQASTMVPDSAAPVTRDAMAHDKMILARHYEQQVLVYETVDSELLKRTVQLYREATELDPDSALAHSRLAGALMYLGDIKGAEAAAFKALEIDPNRAEVQHTLGKLLFALGRPNMGEPLARAVQLNPNLPDALSDYAYWRWFNLGEQGVDDIYRRALELDPLNVGRYGALGTFLAVNDDYEGARQVIEQLKALFDMPESYRAVAKIYDLIGDVDHAIAWTLMARDAEPGNPEHKEKLAEYFVDIGDDETAMELTPDLGVGLLFKMRRFQEMIDKAELLIIEFPEDMRLRIFLASAYSVTGRHDLAVRLLTVTGFLDTIPNGNRGPEDYNAYSILIDAIYRSGEVNEARELISWSKNWMYRGENAYWWVSVRRACEAAILDDTAEVHRRLQQALKGNQLPWDPLLKDVACFEGFADDPIYLAVVAHFENRRKMLRSRLPTTLADYGVSL